MLARRAGRNCALLAAASVVAAATPAIASTASGWHFVGDVQVVVVATKSVSVSASDLEPAPGRYAAVYAPTQASGSVAVSLASVGPTPLELPLTFTPAVSIPAGHRVVLDLMSDGSTTFVLPDGLQVVASRISRFHDRLQVATFTTVVDGEAASASMRNGLRDDTHLVTAAAILYPSPPILASRHADACPTTSTLPQCQTSPSKSDFLQESVWGGPNGGFGADLICYGRTYAGRQDTVDISGYVAAPSTNQYESADLLAFGFRG